MVFSMMVFGLVLLGEQRCTVDAEGGKVDTEGAKVEEEGMEVEEGLEAKGGLAGETSDFPALPEGGSSEGKSQEGGKPGRSSTVVPGMREEGRASRCLTNVTWNELRMRPFDVSQR